VIPALPGYGFSRGLARPTGSRAMADIMAQLMRLLGYGSYVAQGGDLGAMVSTQLGIHDSPVGAAAWIVEKFAAWSDLPRNADGVPDLLSRYTREQLLTNIMFYVVPGSFATAAWLYHGLLRHPDDMPFAAGRRCTTPTGVAALPDPVSIPPPRSLAEKSHSIAHWTKMPSGGHFAAMEQPALLAEDVRHLSGSLGDPASLRLI
jgi:pimeloyl-ACP methyl ester carboxylesterase